jgi:hypothetical protein
MGVAGPVFCLGCHGKDTGKPAIQRLARWAEVKSEVPWARVYLIPSYVFFSHRAHLETGAGCDTCHGAVQERDVLFREADITMGGCMNCHVKNRARNDCNYCHETR